MTYSMPTETQGKVSRKQRILIVEDHAATRLAMSKMLRDTGAEVVTARDGEEGLGYLLTSKFDVLLTDLRMPVMDGFELLHQVQSLPESRKPDRVIAISGEYEPSALQGSSAQFMPKPIDLNTLLSTLAGRPN